MKFNLRLLGILTMLIPFAAIGSNGWTGGMNDGSVVRIDPESNQATRFSGDGAVQLWDGVHRMQDGSTLTVKDGVVTSRTSGERGTGAPTFTPTPSGSDLTPSACVGLVVKVCGFNGECREAPACAPARQLMELEKSEAWQTRQPGPNQTTSQCLDAMENEDFFKPCGALPESAPPTACDKLVEHACGTDQQCSGARSCAEARQFKKMENRHQARKRDPEAPTPATRQCREALKSKTGFPACDG